MLSGEHDESSDDEGPPRVRSAQVAMFTTLNAKKKAVATEAHASASRDTPPEPGAGEESEDELDESEESKVLRSKNITLLQAKAAYTRTQMEDIGLTVLEEKAERGRAFFA